MKKIIAFSVWGTEQKYLRGCVENIKLANKIYPDWTTRFYCDEKLGVDFLNKLRDMGAEIVIKKTFKSSWEGLFWRFAPAFETDVDVFISRDIDSRLNVREKAAVDEWLNSDKDIHSMRDHIEHNVPMLGGMWGCRNSVLNNLRETYETWGKNDYKGSDQDFLRTVVWSDYRNKIITHDRYAKGIILPQIIKDIELFKTYIENAINENNSLLQARDNYIAESKQIGIEPDNQVLENNYKLVVVPEILYNENGEAYNLYEYSPYKFFGEHDLREFPAHAEMSNCVHVGEIIE